MIQINGPIPQGIPFLFWCNIPPPKHQGGPGSMLLSRLNRLLKGPLNIAVPRVNDNKPGGIQRRPLLLECQHDDDDNQPPALRTTMTTTTKLAPRYASGSMCPNVILPLLLFLSCLTLHGSLRQQQTKGGSLWPLVHKTLCFVEQKFVGSLREPCVDAVSRVALALAWQLISLMDPALDFRLVLVEALYVSFFSFQVCLLEYG